MLSSLPDMPTVGPWYQPEASRPTPTVIPPPPAGAMPLPIDSLVPGSELHAAVLAKLLEMLKASEDKMSNFHKRWQVSERRYQAWIAQTDFDKMLTESNKKGYTPSATTITVPYSFATIWTTVTYLTHTFCGRKPILQVGSYSAEAVEPARKMETLLQFGADYNKLVGTIIRWMMDGQIYGVGAVRNLWETHYKKQTRQSYGSPLGGAAPDLLSNSLLTQQSRYLCFEGNNAVNIDPYNFFPDPRVPMTEVNKKGEFVFWRNFEGHFSLLKSQADGLLKWIEAIGAPGGSTKGDTAGPSERGLVADGDPHPGADRSPTLRRHFHQLDQGTVELIPAEWGLGEEEVPEKWLFTIANKRQIIQAEPFDADHDRHPVAVIEPNSMGYGFGQLAISDMLGPIQDTLSWFVNSHMYNVRAALNNMFVVDPAFIELQDLKNPEPGKIIRMKQAAMGRDIKTILHQLNVTDVTQNHIADMQNFMRIGDTISAVSDNLRGLQESGGRKSATEVRMTGESGVSRLAAIARLCSTQGMTDLAFQQTNNIQQYQSMEFYLKIVGMEGAMTPINPDDVQGNFYFPVHDGSLPLDRIALFDIWRQIWTDVSTNPLLMMQYDGFAIFEHMAELGGAQNIANFRVQMAPPGVGMPQGGVPFALPGQGAGFGEFGPQGPTGAATP